MDGPSVPRRIRGVLKVFGLLFRWLLVSALEGLLRLVSPAKRRKSVVGKVVLVTGASRGLGRELALSFGQLGAKVVLWSSKQANVDSVVSELRSLGVQAYGFQCDVSDENQVSTVARRLLSQVGPLDILVNNAAVPQHEFFLQTEAQDVRRIMGVNLFSHFWTMQQFLPGMIAKGQGQVVCINSILASTPAQKASAYSCAKAGLSNLMEAVDIEIQHKHPECKIQFTNIYPGVFLSGMIKKSFNKIRVLFPVVTAKEMAAAVMDAILRNETEVTIPKRIGVTVKLARLFFSRTNYREAQDFINYDVEVTI